ncbi:MAG: hypothetical protein CVT66_11800 [Actinobacteria bacterium HGW-Actinobacteria-6]|nr:MAG: hypothetical protein CVT66_11800 [Actinobacteria bacterium HGW-Actinobacteria-6]
MRRALIVASEFGAPGDEPLTTFHALAEDLSQVLGEVWDVHDTLVNPTAEQVKATIREVVASAARQQQTLLLAFLGHGEVRKYPNRLPDFYLQYKGSAEEPNSETSLHLVPVLKELLSDHAANGLDGLILLVDACATGGVPQQALDLGPLGAGRLEVLVAADDGSAFGGCFTRTLTHALTEGIPRAGETIHPANIFPLLVESCANQSPTHLSLTNGYLNVAGAHDPALWLMPNRTRAWHALLSRPDAGLLDQVTEGVSLSQQQRVALQSIKDHVHERLRVIHGPAGTGKTTVLASLIAPQQDRFGQTVASSVSAAVFLNRTSTPEAVVVEIADQLSDSRGDGADREPKFASNFSRARGQVASQIKAGVIPGPISFADQELILPLARCLDPTCEPIQIVLDGLDQVHPNRAPAFLELVSALVTAPSIERLRVVASIRESSGPLVDALSSKGASIRIDPPAWRDIPSGNYRLWLNDVITTQGQSLIPGGWLTVRLLQQLEVDPASYDLGTVAAAFLNQSLQRLSDARIRETAVHITELLSVTGVGPILPLVVLKEALRQLGDSTETSLGTILATLGPLIVRGRAGFLDEHLGYAHVEIARTIAGSQRP